MKVNKERIPKAIREQVWLKRVGKKFNIKCLTTWCSNEITCFDFQTGHDIPSSKGGTLDIENLFPICARCNTSMTNMYTFKQWCKLSKPVPKWKKLVTCFVPQWRRIQHFDTEENGTRLTRSHLNPNGRHTK